MATNYEGWTLTDKIILVSRPEIEWNENTRSWETANSKQAYVVDPKNSKMLENARRWAEITEYGKYDEETHSYPNKKVIKGEEVELNNDGFTLELFDSADDSTQGGKLSFWNCLIHTPSGNFKIGINADLLLDVLRFCDFKKGVCQQPVCFARRKGQVGLLNKDMPEYSQALADMQKKKDVKKGTTTKWEIGHIYETLTSSQVYITKMYQWFDFELITHYQYGYNYIDGIKSIKLLDKPKCKYLTMDYDENMPNMSDYIQAFLSNKKYFDTYDRLPSRKESGSIKTDQPKGTVEFNYKSYYLKCITKTLNEWDSAKKKGLQMNPWSSIQRDLYKYLYQESEERPNNIPDQARMICDKLGIDVIL